MAGKVIVVGTGPGGKSYITPYGLEKITNAKILVGGQRLLDTFGSENQEMFPIKSDLKKVVDFIKEKVQINDVVVLVSGDTGIFSFANYLSKHIEDEMLEFVPGISSIQLMFARLKRPWNEAQILSMHGRSLDSVSSVVKDSQVTALLTGEPWTPQKIAQYLTDKGVPDLKTVIGKNLSYPEEKIIGTSLKKLPQDKEDYSNSVMVIFNE